MLKTYYTYQVWPMFSIWTLKRTWKDKWKAISLHHGLGKLILNLLKPTIYWGNLIIVLFLVHMTLCPTFSDVAPLCKLLTYKQILSYFTPGICLIMNMSTETKTFGLAHLVLFFFSMLCYCCYWSTKCRFRRNLIIKSTSIIIIACI